MRTSAAIVMATCLLAGTACGAANDAPGDIPWAMFAGNPARDGNSGVAFPSAKLGLLWASPKPDVIYKYQKGQTGSSPCLVSVGEKHLLIVGSYDRNVYAYDAFTGQEQWRFTTGDAVTATPCYAEIDGQPMLFAASSDRTVYAINPLTGKQRDSRDRQMWTHRFYPWAETVAPAFVGEPAVVVHDGRSLLLLTVWINDRKSQGNVQQSTLYAFDAPTGQVAWKTPIGPGTASAPAVGKVKDTPAVFVVHDAGSVNAFSLSDGKPLWPKPFISQDATRSGVSYAEIDGRRLLFFGSRLFSAFCIDADTAEFVWELRVGTWVDSTPAVFRRPGERTLVILGDYQQVIHGVDAFSGHGGWRYRSYGYFSASPVLIEFGGSPAAVMPCLDNHLYIVKADDGSFLFRAYTGEFLWSHYQRGATVFPSAAAARLGGRPLLAVASYDGRVHVFGNSGQDANVGPPRTRIVDALGGRIFAYVFGTLIVVALVYNGIRIARRSRK